ncbi:pimeloyl-ACP methyl ester carboxylesterase [Kribbella aluminosa]|uniref:Pimeloyl-ACP methyl ester carboxylesterase n=1 Tax=Kribbella aluminosa TaxID=416017 RepID=A0ABS4UPR3_9ACTN|nr:alpha/beta hydrolase [Kribbella aluminosa]MBP2353632.1 pimeloyl-ACP methyl ester carboxylesterase [Kribbella aluminosa]
MAVSEQLAERFRANHELLVAARDRLQAAVDAGTASADQRKRLDTVNELLVPVKDTAVDSDGNVVEIERPRQFLKVDPEGKGRAIEVLGDLGHAKHLAVVVPGMGNSLDTFRGQSDRGELIRQEAGPDTAAVVWFDYDSPQGLLEAAGKEAAIDGGPRLAECLDELDELKDEDADVTVVAHSYGTDVAAEAVMKGGARPARLVMTGSPGIEKYVDEAADFVQPPTRLFTERAPGDYVAYSEWHGPDPATFPDAIRMATADPHGQDPVSVHWHNEYYRPNSEALRNVGRVVRGDLDAITTTDTGRGEETKLAWGVPLNKASQVVSAVYNEVTGLPDRDGAAAAAYGGVVAPSSPSMASAASAAVQVKANIPFRPGSGQAKGPRQ